MKALQILVALSLVSSCVSNQSPSSVDEATGSSVIARTGNEISSPQGPQDLNPTINSAPISTSNQTASTGSTSQSSGSGTSTNPSSGSGTPTNPSSGSGTPTNPSSGSGTPTNPSSGSGAPTNPSSGSGSPTNPSSGTVNTNSNFPFTVINSTDGSVSKSDNNAGSFAISADARYVAYLSWVSGGYQLYRRDLNTKTVSNVNITQQGAIVQVVNVPPQISQDGRYILFISRVNSLERPFRKDMITGELTNVMGDPSEELNGFTTATLSDDGTKVLYGSLSAGGFKINERNLTTRQTTILSTGHTYPIRFSYGKDNTIFYSDTVYKNRVSLCPGLACGLYKLDLRTKQSELVSTLNQQNPGYSYGGGMLSRNKSYVIYPLGDKDQFSRDSKITYRIKNLDTGVDSIVDSPDDTLFSAKFWGIQYQVGAMYGDNEMAIVNINHPTLKTRMNGPVVLIKDYKTKKNYLFSLRKVLPDLAISDEMIADFQLSSDKKHVLFRVFIEKGSYKGIHILWGKLDDVKLEVNSSTLKM